MSCAGCSHLGQGETGRSGRAGSRSSNSWHQISHRPPGPGTTVDRLSLSVLWSGAEWLELTLEGTGLGVNLWA